MDESTPSGKPGAVEWEITEAPSGVTLRRGRRDVGPDDVEVVEVVPFPERARQARSEAPLAGKVLLGAASAVARAYGALQGLASGGRRGLYRKRLRLDGDFYLELVDRPTRRRGALAGFGLGAGREAVPTRSSGFFGIDDGERARRPREEGELRVWLERDPYGDWGVARTEFLTNVSLTVGTRRGTPDGGTPGRDGGSGSAGVRASTGRRPAGQPGPRRKAGAWVDRAGRTLGVGSLHLRVVSRRTMSRRRA